MQLTIHFLKLKRLAFYPAALTLVSLCLTGQTPMAQTSQRADETQVETALQNKLQSMLDRLVGPERTIVQVDVTIFDQASASDHQKIRKLRYLPGVAAPGASKEPPGTGEAFSGFLTPIITSMHITVAVDNSLPPEEIAKIEPEVSKWAGLNPARGDTIKIVEQDWRTILAPPSASQQNYILYSMLALAALLIMIAAIYFPLRKLKTPTAEMITAAVTGAEGTAGGGTTAQFEEERRRARKEELEEFKQVLAGAGGGDSGAAIAEIKELLEQALPKTPTQVNAILEEMKELLRRSPQESDALLSEIRDTLSDMLDEQKKIVAGGGMGGGPVPPGGVVPAAASVSGAPAGGPGGMVAGHEIVEALGNIEELISLQLEKTPETGVLDEPFKYLKGVPPEDIDMLIADENPKLAAAVLSQIDPKAAADVLQVLDEEKQLEIAAAMTGLTETEDMAEEIKSFLERKLKIVRLHKDYVPVLGYRVLADIFSSSRYAVAKVLLAKLANRNPAMADEVRKRMFLFEDIVTLQDKDLEVLMHNLPRELVSYALADTSEQVKNRIFKNMTDRAREMIQEDLESFKKVELEREGKELSFNETIQNLDQNVIEEVFRTVDRNVLKMALRGASEQAQEKFLGGLTPRAVAMIKEDLEVMGPIPRKRADEAQQEIMQVLRTLSSRTMEAQHEIIATIRKLEREGQISVERFQEEMI